MVDGEPFLFRKAIEISLLVPSHQLTNANSVVAAHGGSRDHGLYPANHSKPGVPRVWPCDAVIARVPWKGNVRTIVHASGIIAFYTKTRG